MATSTTALTAEEEATAAALPVFSTRELQVCKADSRNRMTFGVPAHSSMLLQLRRPKPHAYEEKDHRWLHLLEAVAAVPSRKVDMIQKLVVQSLQLLPSPVWKQNLEKSVRALLAQLEGAKDDFYKRALVTLQLKDRVAQFLREWLADPIEGFVLTKEHIVAGLRLDDLVATPVGAGYLRGYRRKDGFCIVLYPWGHGFIHLKHVERLEQAIVTQRKKRKWNEFLALEHQHLYEEVESLLENYPPEQPEEGAAGALAVKMVKLTPEGVDVEEYTKLVESLQEEEHFDPEVLQHDLTFVRRVQALAAKTRELQQHKDEEGHEEEGDLEEYDEQEQEQSEMEGPEQTAKSEGPAEEEIGENGLKEEPLEAGAEAMAVE
ncbi:hypothetical protein Gpo141_00009107 [Globisporangium polare]